MATCNNLGISSEVLGREKGVIKEISLSERAKVAIRRKKKKPESHPAWLWDVVTRALQHHDSQWENRHEATKHGGWKSSCHQEPGDGRERQMTYGGGCVQERS